MLRSQLDGLDKYGVVGDSLFKNKTIISTIIVLMTISHM